MKYVVEVLEYEFGYDSESIDYHVFSDFDKAKEYALMMSKSVNVNRPNSKFDIWVSDEVSSWWVMYRNKTGIEIYRHFGDGTKIIYPSGAMSEKDIILGKDTLIEGEIFKKGTKVKVLSDLN